MDIENQKADYEAKLGGTTPIQRLQSIKKTNESVSSTMEKEPGKLSKNPTPKSIHTVVSTAGPNLLQSQGKEVMIQTDMLMKDIDVKPTLPLQFVGIPTNAPSGLSNNSAMSNN